MQIKCIQKLEQHEHEELLLSSPRRKVQSSLAACAAHVYAQACSLPTLMTAAENSLEQKGQPHSVCRPRASLWFQCCRKAFEEVWPHVDDLAEAPRRNITRRHDTTQPSKAPPTTTNIQNNQSWPQQNLYI